MSSPERYLELFIKRDLKKKMVFLSGPRQVGKTTMALRLLHSDESSPAYFNWDNFQDQQKLLKGEFPAKQKLFVFDEIHKFKRWRNWLKGIYDKSKSKHQYLITGSARLDYYRRSGDSLMGRYFHYRLHPLSLREVDAKPSPQTLEDLLELGGFPEPFFSQSKKTQRRWQRQRLEQVFQEDVRDLEKIEDLVGITQMAGRLPDLVGSPLSINGLREDLQVAHRTASNWLNILERLYFSFSVLPFGSPKIKAVKKEKKTYLWDWSLVSEPGERFENLVACQLLKYCHFIEDTEGYSMELRYLRDVYKREIDFVILRDGKIEFVVECQSSDKLDKPQLEYFAKRLPIPQIYLVHLKKKDYESPHLPLRVLPFWKFVKELKMP